MWSLFQSVCGHFFQMSDLHVHFSEWNSRVHPILDRITRLLHPDYPLDLPPAGPTRFRILSGSYDLVLLKTVTENTFFKTEYDLFIPRNIVSREKWVKSNKSLNVHYLGSTWPALGRHPLIPAAPAFGTMLVCFSAGLLSPIYLFQVSTF